MTERARRAAERVTKEVVSNYCGAMYMPPKLAVLTAIISEEMPVEKLVEAIKSIIAEWDSLGHDPLTRWAKNMEEKIDVAEAALRLWEEEK